MTEGEAALLIATHTAHQRSACRDNVSTTALMCGAVGSGDFARSLAAAVSCLGGAHAPLRAAIAAQKMDVQRLWEMILDGQKAPGWGNSFHKGEPDPGWVEVDAVLKEHFPARHRRLAETTKFLHSQGKMIFPNPGGYTAATVIAVGMPEQLADWWLIRTRLDSWAEIFLRATTKQE